MFNSLSYSEVYNDGCDDGFNDGVKAVAARIRSEAKHMVARYDGCLPSGLCLSLGDLETLIQAAVEALEHK